MPAGSRYPALAAAPGMTIGEVVEASTVAFVVPAEGKKDAYIQPKDPHRFVFEHPEVGFEVPAGLFSLVEARRGKVRRVRVSPQLGYLGVVEVVALVEDIADAIEQRGWVPDGGTHEAVLATYLRKTGSGHAGEWRAKRWLCEIRVERAVEAETPLGRSLRLGGDGFLVTLVIAEDELAQ